MKLGRLFVIALLVGAMGVVGCGDDGGSSSNGGGGSAAEDICNFGRCLDSQPLFDECVDAVNICLSEGNTDAQCKVVADQKCVGG